MTSVKLMIGDSFAETKRRVLDAVARAKAGDLVEPVDTISFESWKALASVMTDKRYELLHELRRAPSKDIAALARQLKRDYKRVYLDDRFRRTAPIGGIPSGREGAHIPIR